MKFYTDGALILPALAGNALLIGKIWDAINDPLFGWITDKTKSRFGKRRVFMIFGAIPLGDLDCAVVVCPTRQPDLDLRLDRADFHALRHALDAHQRPLLLPDLRADRRLRRALQPDDLPHGHGGPGLPVGGGGHASHAALEHAARRVRVFHERERHASYEISEDGVRVGSRVDPLARIGIYVPGGKARYPSTVIMTAVPARVAGVREIVMTHARAVARDAGGRASGRRRPRVRDRRRAGDRRDGVRHRERAARRQDRRPGERLRRGRQAAGVRRRRHRFDRRTDRGRHRRRRQRRPALDRGRSARAGRARRGGGPDPDRARQGVRRRGRRRGRHASSPSCRGARSPTRSLADQGAIFVVDSDDEIVRLVNLLAPEHAELALRDARALAAQITTAGRGVHRRAHARVGGRLHRRPQPRVADRRQRALRVAAGRGRLHQADVDHRIRRRRARARRRTTSNG